MKRVIFIIIILLGILSTLIVIPSFKLSLGVKNFVWPEIDYSKIFGGTVPLNFDFKKGGDFETTTVVKMLVESGQEDDAKVIAEIARQRAEIMSSSAKVSYFKEGDDYYVKVAVSEAGSLADKHLFALTNTQKIQIMKEKELEESEDGQPIVSEESPFLPVALDYDTAKNADFGFDSSVGRYVVEVEFDKGSLAGINEVVIAPSGGAFIGEDPIAAVITGGTATEPKLRFATSSEVGRKESLVVYALLATRTYPVPATEVSRELFQPQRSEKDLILFAAAFSAGFIVLSAFYYFTYRSIWKFNVLTLGLFSVITLALFKMSLFEVEITSSSLLGFLIGFVVTSALVHFVGVSLGESLKESSTNAKEKLFREILSKKNATLRAFLLFLLFLLIILNMLYPEVGKDISVGFGYCVVALLILFVFFVRNIFWNLYVSPINIKLNVFKRINKK